MTKRTFIFIVSLMFFAIVQTVTATEPMQMTLTLQPNGKVFIDMAGTGTVIIDWGEGKTSKTHILSAYDEEDWNNDWRKKQPKYRFSYTYSKKTKSTQSITIIGENISHLECGSLGLTSIDVSNNTVLTYLWCYNNHLTSLDISKNIALEYLSCSENQLSNLDVSNNTTLEYLSCSENLLSNLDVSKNTALKYLHCFENQLTNLDISRNIELIDLYCSENQLSILDISKNITLTNLFCSENQLTNLDVSNNNLLKYLWCSDNQLTILNVSYNIELKDLYCYNNQIISLEVGQNTTLRNLDCCSNHLSATALDALFEMLHNNTASEKAVNIGYNIGTDACEPNIATSKGWVIISPTWVKIPIEDEFTPKTKPEEDDDEQFEILDKPPLFNRKSAELGFRRYVGSNTIYSQVAQNNGIEGRVLVEFTINRQGEIVKAKTRQGAHPILKAEALRVINSSPKWSPGMKRGKPVKVKYVFPISFKLRR